MQKAVIMGLILPRRGFTESPGKKKHPRPSGWHIAFQSTSARMCEALTFGSFSQQFETAVIGSHHLNEVSHLMAWRIHSIHALITADTCKKEVASTFHKFLYMKHMNWLAAFLRIAWPKVDPIPSTKQLWGQVSIVYLPARRLVQHQAVHQIAFNGHRFLQMIHRKIKPWASSSYVEENIPAFLEKKTAFLF